MPTPQISHYPISRLAINMVRSQQGRYNGYEYVRTLNNIPTNSKNIIKVGSDKGCLNLLKCPIISMFFTMIYTAAYENKEKIYFISISKGEEYFVCSDFMYNEIAPLCVEPY